MPFTIERLPDEPIIIVRLQGTNPPEEQRDIYVQSAKLAEDINGHVWRISDFSGLDMDETFFARALQAAKVAKGKEEHSTVDPNVTVFFVAPTKSARFIQNALVRNRPIPVFHNMDDAIKAARLQIEKITTTGIEEDD